MCIVVNLWSKVYRMNDICRYGSFSYVSNILGVCDITADLIFQKWKIG
jgi:hypothetical protein